MKFYETNVIAGHLQSVPETEGRDFFFPINITCSCTSVDFAGMEVLRGWGLVACFISYFLPKKEILIFDCMCNKRQGDRQRSTDPATGNKKLANKICQN